MSSDLSPYTTQLPGDSRRAGRAISRHQAASQVRVAAVDADVDGVIAKTEGYTTAIGTAAAHVLRVAQLQRQLEQLAPEASGRLAILADDHALTMAEMLGDLRRDLRRR